ncbi:hypothetical protein CPB86DRAFT_784877 [Serendipita vermifera]|nr:hypothetical protein CPB86DRAFT_784877 [Serendipita vermifera]
MAEYQESITITFEWNIRGLKNLFESSRGENKSRVTRSTRFGGGKWQILFYANSGEGNFISLYLNCEPTQEEKDNAVNGRWIREGLFKFSFELRNSSRTISFNTKEACDHTFSYRTQNWGWAQFAKRDSVYFGSPAVRQTDSFVVICTITSSPVPPTNLPRIKKRIVPSAMLDVIGSLLDDPTYSDVEFVFPHRRSSKRRSGMQPKKIWASKKILMRAEYFEAMFNSGFSEDRSLVPSRSPAPRRSPTLQRLPSSGSESSYALEDELEDSDLEDEAAEAEMLNPTEERGYTDPEEFITPSDEHQQNSGLTEGTHDSNAQPTVGDETRRDSTDEDDSNQNLSSSSQGINASPPLPPVPTTNTTKRDESLDVVIVDSLRNEQSGPGVPGPPKTRVMITDVAYSTYRAVLYYLYTDSIIFAPLASSFYHKSRRNIRASVQRATGDISSETQRNGEESMTNVRPNLSRRSTQVPPPGSEAGGSVVGAASTGDDGSPATRAQWIREWGYENPGRPLPCSAKAVYRLADKLDLADLKERAREHIVKSLTVTNVPHEVFSSFSATFEEIRKVQIDYFLANWGEIRGSEAMSDIWHQIRNGRHPGFEQVWPLIAQNLEYRATQAEGTVGDAEREGVQGE